MRGHGPRTPQWAVSIETGLDLVFWFSENSLACDLTAPVLPSVCATNLTAPKEAPWLGSGQVGVGTQSQFSPLPSPDPSSSPSSQAQSKLPPGETLQKTAGEWGGNLGLPRGEEGGKKKGKEVRKGKSGAPRC